MGTLREYINDNGKTDHAKRRNTRKKEADDRWNSQANEKETAELT